MNYDNDPGRAASLMGQKKVRELVRHQAVLAANGVGAKDGWKEALSGVDNISVAEKYHASRGTQGSIINKALGGRFGPQG